MQNADSAMWKICEMLSIKLTENSIKKKKKSKQPNQEIQYW